MGELENYINLGNLEAAKKHLVPYIFTENYYNILKTRLKGKKLTYNEQYYYSHFIKKKLKGIVELMGIDTMVNGRKFVKKKRLNKAAILLKKYSRKHKNMKVLVSGSFLYNEEYKDIDVFVISKYEKEDYRDGKVHINYLPANIGKTLFFHSIYNISVSNFKLDGKIKEDFDLSDVLHTYEVVILQIIQKDNYLQELRDLILRLEYISNNVTLSSMQIKTITDRIISNKNTIQVINKYLVAKIINAYKGPVLKRSLRKFIEKNSFPEKGQKIYENWRIYNQTYMEAIEVVT